MPLPTKANTTRPSSRGYDALLEWSDQDADSLYLRLAVGPGRTLQLETVDPNDKAPSVAENPEDLRPESGKSFSRDDFGGGEGLRRAHRRNGTDRDYTRYFDSMGIDITPSESGEATTLKLAQSTETTPERAAGLMNDGKVCLFQFSSFAAMLSDNTRIDTTFNVAATSPSWTVENPHAGEGDAVISAIAALGNELYACFTSSGRGVHKRSAGGTWSHWSDQDAVRLWGLKGRMLAGNSGFLYELAAGGDSVLVHTVGGSGKSHVCAVDAGDTIIVGSNDGNLYFFTDQDGVLTEVASLPIGPGEYPTSLAYAQGLLMVFTQETTSDGSMGRLYVAQVIGRRLRNTQLLKTWNPVSTSVLAVAGDMIATRNAFWIPVPDSTTQMSVWKYYMATGALVRAHVFTDATFTHGGYSEGLAVYDGRLVVRVDGDGLYRVEDTYVDEGYLISPLADFYSAAKKTWVGLRLQTGDLPAGTQVDLYYTTNPVAIEDRNHADWELAITADSNSPGVGDETAIIGVEARFAALMVVLTPDGTNVDTPEVLSMAIRGIGMPTEEDYPIPVNVSDRLELPGRKPIQINGAGDAVYQKLETLIGKAVTLELFRPAGIIKGQVRALSAPIQGLPERGSATVYALLTVRGQRQ